MGSFSRRAGARMCSYISRLSNGPAFPISMRAKPSSTKKCLTGAEWQPKTSGFRASFPLDPGRPTTCFTVDQGTIAMTGLPARGRSPDHLGGPPRLVPVRGWPPSFRYLGKDHPGVPTLETQTGARERRLCSSANSGPDRPPSIDGNEAEEVASQH